MFSPVDYVALYGNIHSNERKKYIVKTREITYAIKNMAEVYKPDPSLWNEKIAPVANYDDPAYRCAYLFKYAPLHTFLIQDIFIRVLSESAAVINPDFWTSNSCLNICSLGGGPGIDVVGVLSALNRKYGLVRCSAKIIESMPGWKDTFNSVLEELRKNCSGLSPNLTSQYFEFSFIVADLLGKMDSVVNKAIGSADMLTMIKFLSAATCINTTSMVRKIFNSMRHGAVIFIIDNASGGYSELVSRIAEECRMVPVFGPLQYVQYNDPRFMVHKRYRSHSCSSTQVAVHFLMKPYVLPVIEWRSLNLIVTDHKLKTDISSASENVSVSFCKSDYDSDNSKKDLKSLLPQESLPSKINPTLRKEDNYYDALDVNYDTSNDQFLMATSYEASFSTINTISEEYNESSGCHINYYDSLKIKPLQKIFNLEADNGLIPSLTEGLKLSNSEKGKFGFRCNYPLYELFPQNKICNKREENESFTNSILPFLVEPTTERNQIYDAPTFENNLEKPTLGEENNEIQHGGNRDSVETNSNALKYVKDSVEETKKCINCFKLNRIKWLQEMCKFCNMHKETL